MTQSYRVMLDEMRHSFDTAYASVAKYANKTFAIFGGELAFILFYMSNTEIATLIQLFRYPDRGWSIFVMLAVIAFTVATVLFVLTLATDRRWMFPPVEERLLYRDQYKTMSEEELAHELIKEYNDCIDQCVKKVHRMKVLTDTGTYFLIGGIVCLLIIKIFGV